MLSKNGLLNRYICVGGQKMEKSNEFKDYDYSYLRRLPIDKLLELLEIAPALSDDPEDEAYLDALEEAIIEKENENPTGFFPDVDQQWEQFVAHYMPDMRKAALESEPAEHAVSPQTNHQPFEVPQKRVVRFSRIWRTALVAAAAIACMFAVMVTAQAAGIDVFGAMARWTKDVFSFGQIVPDSEVSDNLGQETEGPVADAQDPNREFASLQEALDAYGMTEVHEPSWLPEGYALDSIDVLALDDPFLRTFDVIYTNGEKIIGIGIMNYEDEPSTQVQKIDGPVESMVKDGITFYLIQNTNNWTVAWCTGQYEFYVSSKEGKDILWQVVESMFT